MKRFAALIARLEGALPRARQVGALLEYLGAAPPADAAWAVRLLAGRGLGRRLHADALCEAACRAARVERWLFDASLAASGDIAETIAHLLPAAPCADALPLSQWIEDRWLALPREPLPADGDRVLQWCATLDAPGREPLLRLMLGRWRTPIDEPLLLQALAQHAGVDIRLLGLRWPAWLGSSRRPDASRFAALLQPRPTAAEERSFADRLAAPQATDAHTLAFAAAACGRATWVLHAWRGGAHAQLVRRAGGVWLWSPSGELLNRRCAEVRAAAAALPVDTVLEGELDVTGFAVSDLLQLDGVDLRDRPYAERLARAQALRLAPPIAPAARVGSDAAGASLADLLARCRAHGRRGLLALRGDAPHGVAQALLLPPPLRATAAVRTAQWVVDGGGVTQLELGLAAWSRRPRDDADLADALRRMAAGSGVPIGGAQLVPLASLRLEPPEPGDAADRPGGDLLEWIRQSTQQRFGPVRLLRLGRICEIAFDGLEANARRKSGISLLGVRLQRWRDDGGLIDVDDLGHLRDLAAPRIDASAPS